MERVARAMAKAEKRLARPELREDEDPSVWPLAWLVAIAIVPLAAFFQQYTLWLGSSTLENAPEALRTSEAAHPPEVSELVINGKFVVKMMHFMDDDWDGG